MSDQIPLPERTRRRRSLWRGLLQRPLGLISAIFLLFVAVIALIGPWLAPYDPNQVTLSLVLAPPSAEHLLGGDSSGRDVLSRLLAATQISIAAALVALVTALVLGVTLGLIAGYYRGWFDTVSTWIMSLFMALPGMVVLLAARASLGPSVWTAMFIFGIMFSPAYYRLVYAAVSDVRKELYVDAARVSGLSDTRIIGRHVLNVVRAPIIIQSAIMAGGAISIQSGLEFLGVGDRMTATWGGMLGDGFANMYRAPLLMLWPALAITLLCVALTLLANALRDVINRSDVARRKRVTERRALSSARGNLPASDSTAAMVIPPRVIDLGEASEPHPETIIHPDDEYTDKLNDRPKVLTIRELGVGYDKPDGSVSDVVLGVSLQIRKGEVHGLVGESGSGKSQTAFAVLGLLPQGGRITQGSIRYEGTELAGLPDKEYQGIRGKRIGYIPQDPMSNLDPSFTIGSQLVGPLRKQLGMSSREAEQKALALLDRVGIPDPARTFKSYPFQLSGGMAQRVLIAGAVSTDPDLLIADEPTTALDVTIQAEVLDLLRDLQRERQLAMLLVTHNFGVVADLCDRVTVMQRGLFVEQGPTRAILESPEHPYTQSLLDSILDDVPARGRLVTEKEWS